MKSTLGCREEREGEVRKLLGSGERGREMPLGTGRGGGGRRMPLGNGTRGGVGRGILSSDAGAREEKIEAFLGIGGGGGDNGADEGAIFLVLVDVDTACVNASLIFVFCPTEEQMDNTKFNSSLEKSCHGEEGWEEH